MFKRIVFVLAFLVLTAGVSFSAPGDLDITYGINGVVLYDAGDYDFGESVTIQSDGKIVVVGCSNGDVLVLRYNSDGTLDNTFGEDGVGNYDLGSESCGYGVTMQEDGKIVITGTSLSDLNYDALVLRLDSDGNLDNTFGTGGFAVYEGTGNMDDFGYGVAIQKDGKIVIAGKTYNGLNDDVLVLRYNTNGTLDTTFGVDGVVTCNGIWNNNDFGRAIAIQQDGKIIVTGYSFGIFLWDALILRLNGDGTLDSTFGIDGIVLYNNNKANLWDLGFGVAIQQDGKIVVTGYTFINEVNLDDVLVLRYNSDGTLDNTFGKNGVVTCNPSIGYESGFAVAMQSNGKIVIVGSSGNDVLVLRYNSDGTLDSTFNKDGIFRYRISNNSDNLGDTLGKGVAIQRDGKIVVAGLIYNYNPLNFSDAFTLRLIGDTYVNLLTPNGGEIIPSGLIYNVQWDAKGKAEKFELYYSLDNGVIWELIRTVTEFITGTSYDWKVPKTWGNKKACLVKVIGYNSSGKRVGEDTSDAPFTIEVVKLTSPNGGVTYTSGDPLTITWTTNATKRNIAKVKLYYTKDGGITWILIDTIKGSNPGSYDGIVPIVGKTKNNCKVRVELKDALGNILGKDASDSYFTIQP